MRLSCCGAEGRREEEEGRSQKKYFDEYEILPYHCAVVDGNVDEYDRL
ncbi:hypothetical protein [Microcoleus sp. B7-D4]